MAGIFLEGDPRGLEESKLRIVFSDNPGFRLNHGILTPSIIGRVHLGFETSRNAYFPIRDEEDRKLLSGTYATFNRLAQLGSDYYVDVRPNEAFYSSVLKQHRSELDAVVYTLVPQGQDKDWYAQFKYLMVRDIANSAHELIDDFDYTQSKPEHSAMQSQDTEMSEHPGPLALSLAERLKQVVFNNPKEMFDNRPLVQRQLELLGSLGGLLAHVERMSPVAQRMALSLPPEDVWTAIALDRQARSRRPNYDGHGSSVQATGV